MKLANGSVRGLTTIRPDLATQYLFGVYSTSVAGLTGGNHLYLFPSSEYAITSWCDICSEEVLELGTWERAGDEIELIAERRFEPDYQQIYGLDFLRHFIGDFRSLRLFVTGDGGAIEDSILVPRDRLDWYRPRVAGLVRSRADLDWPAELRRLNERFHEQPSQINSL